MKPFQHVNARSVQSATELVADHGAYIAGGIDLLGELKEYIASPKTLVNLKTIPGLDTIDRGEKLWMIGANVTLSTLEYDPQTREHFPGLQEAAAEVGSNQIRQVATVGGNLAQHSRCWYYRQRDVMCLKKGGDKCHARNGENKYHSIFSGNPCVSPVVSNLSVALAALDARVVVLKEGEEVRMTLPELYARAWDNPLEHHSLNAGDLILKVELPVEKRRSAYLQISEKEAFDWALVSCAAAVTLNGSRVEWIRIFLGSIAPIPYQSKAVNTYLVGKELDDKTTAEAADRLLANAVPLAHNGYKMPMARALIQRTLKRLVA